MRIIIILILLTGCSKTMDPNDLLDPTTTIIKKILTGNKK
jgi:hypothetical protein